MKIKTLLVGLTIPLTGFAQSFQMVPQELPNPDNVPHLVILFRTSDRFFGTKRSFMLSSITA